MKNIPYIALYLLVSLTFQACEYITFVNKESEVIKIQKEVGTVKHIKINASCRLILSMQGKTSISIEGQKHLLDNFEINYLDGILNIDHKTNTLQKKKLVEICVSTKDLQRITCNKACEITNLEPLNLKQLTMVMNGSSEFTESNLDIVCQNLSIYCYGNTNIGQHYFKGEVNQLQMKLEGRIKIDALDLLSHKVSFTNKSGYDVYLHVNDHLAVDTYSKGDTYYKGNPEVNHQRYHVPYLNSTGEVIPYN
jgi:hypothetical protein